MAPVLIGDLEVRAVEEVQGLLHHDAGFLDGLPEDAIARNLDWLAPDFCDAASGALRLSMHSWIVRTAHHNVLIDSCFGNDKERPVLEMGHRLSIPYLDRLAEQGLRPEDIDFVMCTHLHVDHVGWNTRLVDGRWVPTFPNAKYLFARKEYDFWNPATGNGEPDVPINQNVFEDSVLPVVEAGQAILVDDGYGVDDQLTVEEASGHSEGHVLICAQSRGRTGIFSGDIIHHPIQIAYPEVNSSACQFADRARATRRRVLEDCAAHGHLLLPAHFTGARCGHVVPKGDGFGFRSGA